MTELAAETVLYLRLVDLVAKLGYEANDPATTAEALDVVMQIADAHNASARLAIQAISDRAALQREVHAA